MYAGMGAGEEESYEYVNPADAELFPASEDMEQLIADFRAEKQADNDR